MRRIFFIAAMMLLCTGCASAELGESCEKPGSADECVDGAICTNDGDANVCRKACGDDSECESGEQCNGITGTNTKSCQPKTSKK